MSFDTAAEERAVLAGILQYGHDGYVDVADIISASSFSFESNQVIYKCLQYLLTETECSKIDLPSIWSTAATLGFAQLINNVEERKYLRGLIDVPISQPNIRRMAVKLKKIEVAKQLQAELTLAKDSIDNVSGDESIDHILGLAENPIFQFTSKLNASNEGPMAIGQGLEEYVDYLANNPCKMIGISSGFTRYDMAIGGGLRRKTVNLIGARPKALRYGSKVYTQSGQVAIETIKVGDIVSHPFQGHTKVTAVYDHNNIDIYRIYFRDGDYVDCCADHLWEVYKRYPYDNTANKQANIKTTIEILNDLTFGIKKEYKWDVRLPNIVEFDKQDVSLDPYILGLLIGDGSFRNAITFSTADPELIDYIKANLSNEIKEEILAPGCTTYRINSLQDEIRKVGLYKVLAKEKFIPDCYKYNTSTIRLAILRGLMDTDGDCTLDTRSMNARCRYSTISKRLALDVKEMVQSLGGLCSIVKQIGTYKGQPHLSYRLEVRLKENPFKLKRKAELFTGRRIGELKRTIIKIEKIDTDNARCLTLENNDGLFMTDNFVVTHNTGKTVFADNVAFHVASQLGFPVLNLDTEMSRQDHWHRILANISGVSITKIETGSFATKSHEKQKVYDARSVLEQIPYHYCSVAGMPFEEIISVCRRWVTKVVGFENNGEAKPCLIIYDYLKLMDTKDLGRNLQEHQVLGFQITNLHNFTVRYSLPCLAFIQLNRDGINREDTDVASGSDRLVWLCSNLSIFKPKSDLEVAEDAASGDTAKRYNRKLAVIVTRHGGGLEDGNYINMNMQRDIARITEGQTRNELYKLKAKGELIDAIPEEDKRF